MPLTLTPWLAPPSLLDLKSDEVHLWRFPLVCSDPLENLLDEQELQRAKRLRSADKARAFVVARARLRQILSAYLNTDPQALRFSCGPAGKPALVGLVDSLSFNLAHSGNWGVCAVVGRGEVGVDVETINPALNYAKLARRFFSETENHSSALLIRSRSTWLTPATGVCVPLSEEVRWVLMLRRLTPR